MALLHLVEDHLRTLDAAPKLIAITVDHGLRRDSAAEAAWVHYFCQSHDIAHRIVSWIDEKPDTGVPAAAREARYRLLSEAARAAESDLILTGHTLDDQIETHSMRRARSDRGAGLSGMAPATLFDRRTWIVRPLLGVRRGDLRGYLRGRNVPWIEDPTNEDTHYERVRVRKASASSAVRDLTSEIRSAQDERRRTARAAAHFIAEHAAVAPDGLVTVSLDGGDGDDRAVAPALAALAAAVGGRPFPVTGREAERVLAFYRGTDREDAAAGGQVGSRRMTAARCVLERDHTALRLWRERRNLPEIVLRPCESAVWDGRYVFRNPDPVHSFHIGPRRTVPKEGSAALRAVMGAEPVVVASCDDEGGAFRGPRETPCDDSALQALEVDRYLPQFDHFLPEFDMGLADSVARLFGRTAYPELPVHFRVKN